MIGNMTTPLCNTKFKGILAERVRRQGPAVTVICKWDNTSAFFYIDRLYSCKNSLKEMACMKIGNITFPASRHIGNALPALILRPTIAASFKYLYKTWLLWCLPHLFNVHVNFKVEKSIIWKIRNVRIRVVYANVIIQTLNTWSQDLSTEFLPHSVHRLYDVHLMKKVKTSVLSLQVGQNG